MNAVDASEHYDTGAKELTPSLLAIVLDTNLHAWALLKDSLLFSRAVANILVFINAHLACNYTNEIAVVASHSKHARWLYPSHGWQQNAVPTSANQDDEVEMRSRLDKIDNVDAMTDLNDNAPLTPRANKYRPFRIVEEQVICNLRELLASTSASDVSATTPTMMAGALTLALSYINRETISWAETHGTAGVDPSTTATSEVWRTVGATEDTSDAPTGLQSRILIISVSSSTDSAHQYIPIMNCIFACQRLRIPIDVCKVSGDAVFLQQASDATHGVYISLAEPRGLLQYLMMAFLPDQRSRRHLVVPSRVDVDFRAACFCHRRIVNIGFVCSICLSIFCEPPKNGDCLTCGTHLELGDYGARPAVIARRKKKKKARINGNSAAATPTPTATPGP